MSRHSPPTRSGFDWARLTPRRVFRGGLRRLGFEPAPAYPKAQAWHRPVDVAVICPAYPGGDRPYGGQFVQSRVHAYRNSGLSVVVLEVREDNHGAEAGLVDGVPVWRVRPKGLARYLGKSLADRVVMHHPEAHSWPVLKPYAGSTRPLLIIHGYEARSWRELAHSKSADVSDDYMDELDATRCETIRDCLSHPDVIPVFVSDFMRQTAERFIGMNAPQRTEIIHNPVLAEDFPYQPKHAADRYRILWLRSFQSHNYGNDLARDAILALRHREDFERFSITVRGDGLLWDESVAPLRALPNVRLQRGFVSREDVADLHADHGVVLVPSRWDSQSLTLGEGMSSGLVPVANRVAAVPEFLSEKEGFLCPPDDASALAEAIAHIADNPQDFLRRSAAASRRMQAQCGRAATVKREVDLLKNK